MGGLWNSRLGFSILQGVGASGSPGFPSAGQRSVHPSGKHAEASEAPLPVWAVMKERRRLLSGSSRSTIRIRKKAAVIACHRCGDREGAPVLSVRLHEGGPGEKGQEVHRELWRACVWAQTGQGQWGEGARSKGVRGGGGEVAALGLGGRGRAWAPLPREWAVSEGKGVAERVGSFSFSREDRSDPCGVCRAAGQGWKVAVAIRGETLSL